MEAKFSVTLEKIIKEIDLEVSYMPDEAESIKVYSRDITRPGLELTGFLDFFYRVADRGIHAEHEPPAPDQERGPLSAGGIYVHGRRNHSGPPVWKTVRI